MRDLSERAGAILAYSHVGEDTRAVIRDQMAEIERWQRLYKSSERMITGQQAEIERRNLEIERLRADAALHDKESGDNAREISRLNAHITKQDAQTERLTAALREIKTLDHYPETVIARAALEGQP